MYCRERYGCFFSVHFLLHCSHLVIHGSEEKATPKKKPPSRLNGVAVHRRDSAALLPEPRCLLLHKAEKVFFFAICIDVLIYVYYNMYRELHVF